MICLNDSLFRSAWLISLILLGAPLACSPKLTSCDISETTCQEDIYYADLRVRGDGIDPFGGVPPVRVISPSEYRDELSPQAGENPPASSDEQLIQKAWDIAFALLHFIDANSTATGTTVDDLVANVAAYYSSSNRTVTVISRPSTTADQRIARMQSLAHEFIHALQDREFDLRRTSATTDESLAYSALIEGDAEFYEGLFANELSDDLGSPLGLTQKNIVSVFERIADRVYANFDHSSPLFFPQLIRYPLGALYLATAWSQGGNAAVRRAYASAPVHSVGFLGPDAAPAVRDCHPPDAAGLFARSDRHMGAIYFYAFLRAWSVSHDVALSMAKNWSGDLMRVATSSDGEHVAVSWRIELVVPPDPSVLTNLAAGGTLGVTSGANSLIITATNSVDPVTWNEAPPCR